MSQTTKETGLKFMKIYPNAEVFISKLIANGFKKDNQDSIELLKDKYHELMRNFSELMKDGISIKRENELNMSIDSSISYIEIMTMKHLVTS